MKKIINYKAQVQKFLDLAGVQIDGPNPWDITVHNENFYKDVLARGSLSLGECYVTGWWDCSNLSEFANKILRAGLDQKVTGMSMSTLLHILYAQTFNMQNKRHAAKNVQNHYDIGADFHQVMLDKRLTYTCGYWKDAQTLDEAQEAKFELICKKLNLQHGQRVLDIGCGYGSFLKYAIKKYGIHGYGITLSHEQLNVGRSLCKGLPIEISLLDYRDMEGRFDHIVSIGMFEHVGVKNYRAYMQKVFSSLADDGLFLLHTIGTNHSTTSTDPWINKYIFPNSMIPSIAQIAQSFEGIFDVMEDWHNFGTDYDTTLMAWHRNLNTEWYKLKDTYGEKYLRMYNYYLLMSAGTFRARKNQLWQIVLSKNGVLGGYSSIR
jgi:cyclopropane-fatty-acyl-phospholipid synthase